MGWGNPGWAERDDLCLESTRKYLFYLELGEPPDRVCLTGSEGSSPLESVVLLLAFPQFSLFVGETTRRIDLSRRAAFACRREWKKGCAWFSTAGIPVTQRLSREIKSADRYRSER